MKKTVTREVDCCDQCGAESYTTKCRKCGKEYCYECGKTKLVEYAAGVYLGDSSYCIECDRELLLCGTDYVHNAFLAIKRLRMEMDAYSADFERRRKAAELVVGRIHNGDRVK